MKHYFKNPLIAPTTPDQLRAKGVDPDDLWFSNTFQTWVFSGATACRFPYHTTGRILSALNITPNPEA